jgi:hypothetical protein
LGLGCRTLIVGRGEQNRPVKPFGWWPRLIAYPLLDLIVDLPEDVAMSSHV